ncbi:MAG: hypothetical protein HKP12_07090 [Gammaproteobacteria bacterium]|nr:hypothetical protein [Gammaproteobacteria bacterium]
MHTVSTIPILIIKQSSIAVTDYDTGNVVCGHSMNYIVRDKNHWPRITRKTQDRFADLTRMLHEGGHACNIRLNSYSCRLRFSRLMDFAVVVVA